MDNEGIPEEIEAIASQHIHTTLKNEYNVEIVVRGENLTLKMT